MRFVTTTSSSVTLYCVPDILITANFWSDAVLGGIVTPYCSSSVPGCLTTVWIGVAAAASVAMPLNCREVGRRMWLVSLTVVKPKAVGLVTHCCASYGTRPSQSFAVGLVAVPAS